MLIQGYNNAFSVAHSIGRRLTDNAVPEKYTFSVIIGQFGNDSRDNWYFIKFYSPRLKRCDQNILEQDVCREKGFKYA